MVRLLLSVENLNHNLSDWLGRPPIVYACWGAVDVLKELLATSAVDPNLEDNDDRTPLHWTACHGSEVAVSHFLARPDVDINAAANGDYTFKGGWTPLMVAVNRQSTAIVKLLLDMPAINAEYQSDLGKTALHLAAFNGSEGIVRLLLAKGVNPVLRTTIIIRL